MEPATPAATVVVLRAGAAGVEVLLLHKSRGHAFGDMWVFPGGRVDDGDGEPGADDCDRARHAAVREAHEEAALVLDPHGLVPFAHWTPPPEQPRRFETWFFLADASDATYDVLVDGGEIVDHAWSTPADALARHLTREVQLATPTYVTLHELRQWATPADALDAARRADVERRTTRLVDVDGTMVALWSGDAGYDTGDAGVAGARHRLAMPATGAWTYERGERNSAEPTAR